MNGPRLSVRLTFAKTHGRRLQAVQPLLKLGAVHAGVRLCRPDEGGVIWIDNLCILADVTPERKAAAESFINFLLDAEIGAMLSDWNWYASPNAAAEEFLDEEFLSDTSVYPTAEVRAKLQFIRPVGEFESVFQRYWDEVKSAQ